MGARGKFARFGKVRRRPDANQGSIILALRRCGATVLDLSSVGDGCPDLLIGYHGMDRLLEVKTAAGTTSAGQSAFARTWRGWPVSVVRSEAEAMLAIGIRLDL